MYEYMGTVKYRNSKENTTLVTARNKAMYIDNRFGEYVFIIFFVQK